MLGVDALLVIPDIVSVDTELITVPLACKFVAVSWSIVSISLTFAALTKISSGSLFISNKLPNDCVDWRGTINILTSFGDSWFII